MTSVKKRGALLAKGRLLGVQFDTLFTNDLYFRISRHAIKMAERMKEIFLSHDLRLYLDSHTNQQFVILKNEQMDAMRERIAFSFWEINSLRFKLATTFYTWCTLEYFINGNSRFKYYSLLSPFIHFGYLIVVTPLLIYNWLKDRTILVWIIFATSFFLTTPAVSLYINSMSQEYMSESVAESVDGYASERGLEGMAERYAEGARTGNLNRAISRSVVDIRNYTVMACVGFLSLLCYFGKNKKREFVRILNFLLLFYAFSNVANSNSQGVRFYATAALLAVCFFIIFIALT